MDIQHTGIHLITELCLHLSEVRVAGLLEITIVT